MLKGEEERIKQLKKVKEFREEERQLSDERSLKFVGKIIEEQKIENKKEEQKPKEEEEKLKESEQKLKELEEKLKESEQKLKEEESANSKEQKKLDDKDNKKRLNGRVKWFNVNKGYGFIEREDKGKDVYVHATAVKNSGLEHLKKDEQLTFEIEYLDKGPSAFNLEKTVSEISRPHLKVVK